MSEMPTIPAIDIEELIGEMPAQSCEHIFHKDDPKGHADGDEHYVHRWCKSGCFDHVVVYCKRIIIIMLLNSDAVMQCRFCGVDTVMRDSFKVLGPVNSGKK